MANLKHKTRGNSSPQGKPRVYFCCHPEDFNKYFESVSDEILSKQNCTIWYDEEELVRDEDFFADLKQMQLFVMPVTTNLLCTENEALDTEFKFAIENHIPVLPLMQESGLEELFNKKCGDLQFLDKNNADVTTISYDEKLKKYLESVLIGDELAEKIRAAFDAYVFLSYRKKDRRYAQELMRLIHKNEFCRDIAIWYDEFLTPGENFNDSIKEALQKSGLFVLTVTPNLVNEQNYIMTTEYPMAKQEGNPILPAEVVSTDREQLSEKYEDIPNPTDAHNEAEFSEALLEAINKMAIKDNDNSPEHNFFIGLAYLSGIDVEVDYGRAVTLITSAAENGAIEAIKKLVTMYSTGLGVERDWFAAIFWQKKVLCHYKQIYLNEKNFKNGWAYYEQLDEAVDILYSYRNSIVVNADKATLSDVKSRDLDDYCLDEIYDILLEGKKLAQELCDVDCTIRSVMLWMASLERLSQLYESAGEIKSALEYATLNLSLYQQCVSRHKNTKYTFALVFVSLRLSRLLNIKGEYEKAKEVLEKIPSFYDALDEKIKNIVSKAYLIEVYIELGDINNNLQNLPAAESNYLSSMEIIKERYEYDHGYTVFYCSVLCKLAAIYLRKHDDRRAKVLLDQGINVLAEFEKEYSDIETSDCLAKLYEIYGDLYKQKNDAICAKEYYDRAHLIRWKTVDERFDLRLCVPMATLYRKIGELSDDLSMLELALDILEKACDSCPEIIEFQKEKKIVKKLLKQFTSE